MFLQMYLLHFHSQAHFVLQQLHYMLMMCLAVTSLQDLLDLDVVGTEATVELKVVGVVEERSPKRKQQLL